MSAAPDGAVRGPIVGVYMPDADQVLLAVEDGVRAAHVALSIAEAEAIRDVLTSALKIRAARRNPVAAVPGAAA